MDEEWDFKPEPAKYVCEECGYVSPRKVDEEFYKKNKKPLTCPQCGSEALVPKGL